MSKQTILDELTKEVSQAKATYQDLIKDGSDDLSKRIFETKIRVYSHALDLVNYHIHDEKEVLDINHIEKYIIDVINDFVAFVKPSREANAFVFDMLKKSICLALQEYNLNGGWISVDNPPEKDGEYLVYGFDDFENCHKQKLEYFIAKDKSFITDLSFVITHWQLLPNPPKEKT